MIAQEKEEHKIATLSRLTINNSESDRRTDEDCPLLGQPARRNEEAIAPSGWTDDDFQALEDDEVIIHPMDLDEASLPSIPPFSNTGGTKCQDHHYNIDQVQKVGIDWLAFSADEPVSNFQKFVNRFIPEVSFFEARKGWQGYKNHYQINLYGQNIGILAYGANHGKPYLSLTGKACLEIEKNHTWEEVAKVLAIFFDYKISRVDLKLDFFFKEVGHDYLKNAYKEGKFKLAKARQNPKFDPREPMDGNGNYLGRTLYIGSRDGGKFFRGYEKGHEQFGKIPELAQKQFKSSFEDGSLLVGDNNNAPEGASLIDWYRMEVEYKSVDRTLPINILTQRDDFFAGSYPICMEVLPMSNPLRPKTLPNNLDVEEALMLKHQGDQYGAFNYSMLSKGMNPIEILQKIIEGHWGHSQRYIKAGGLKDLAYLDPEILNPENWTYTPPKREVKPQRTEEEVKQLIQKSKQEDEDFKKVVSSKIDLLVEENKNLVVKDGYDSLVNPPKERFYKSKK
jgi:DNA relaxase NicK